MSRYSYCVPLCGFSSYFAFLYTVASLVLATSTYLLSLSLWTCCASLQSYFFSFKPFASFGGHFEYLCAYFAIIKSLPVDKNRHSQIHKKIRNSEQNFFPIKYTDFKIVLNLVNEICKDRIIFGPELMTNDWQQKRVYKNV